jgi:hypothetical protein
MKLIGKRYFLTAVFLILGAQRLAAQAPPLEPAQMPANTTFYLIWRGQPSAELRKSNSIAALWDDPGFAPVRSSITKAMLKNSEEKSDEKKLTREQLEEYASLLENPFVLGYLSNPHPQAATAAAEGAKKPTWNGMFFVYDRTGKEAILSKAVLGLRASEKDTPAISPTTIADIPATKVERKSGITYWVEHNKYAISASEVSVLEEILHRLNGKPSSSESLADSASYKEAHSTLGAGQLEFFLRVPELSSMSSNSTAGGFQMRPVLDALKLNAIHSVAGRVLLEGAKTRVQGVALGDTAPGSLFDIWGDGAAAPASLNFASADAISYSGTQLNLTALYEIVRRVAAAFFPPGRQGGVEMLEMMAQAKLGISISNAVALFTGEFASLQTSKSLDKNQQVYVIGIRNKPDTLKLLHSFLGERITSERNEGETTFMKISASDAKNPAAAASSDFYHVAATSVYLIGAPRLESVRELLAKHTQAAGLSSAPGFQSARAQFPPTINGFGYFDFRKVDWPALKARMIAESAKASATPGKRTGATTKSDVSPTPSWMLDIDPAVFARHLHTASSASWKDAQGLHFDQWIE